MHAVLAELEELLRRAPYPARRALGGHEGLLRLWRHVQPLAHGHAAR